MTKCIRNGLLAAIISNCRGAGWSTWNLWKDSYDEEFMLHDEGLVNLIENNQIDKIEDYIESLFPDHDLYISPENLSIEWVKLGTKYRIVEYEGLETLEIENKIKWKVA